MAQTREEPETPAAGPSGLPVVRQIWNRGVARLLPFGWPRRWVLPLTFGLLLGICLAVVVGSLSETAARPVLVPAGPLDQRPDITVTLSSSLLAALIQQSAQQGQSPLRLENVRVQTANGEIIVTGDVPVVGHKVGSTIQMEPVVENGGLRMHLLQARLGSLPVPHNIGQLAEDPINARLAEATNKLPSTITSVRVTADGITVTARVRVEELHSRRVSGVGYRVSGDVEWIVPAQQRVTFHNFPIPARPGNGTGTLESLALHRPRPETRDPSRPRHAPVSVALL
ncbi:MAG: hypothetical protein ACR2PL_15725 [Dehalococcoidia bacterium]